jgi:hypothetical protein
MWYPSVQGKHSIGVLYYLLARMVLQMRGTVTPIAQWDVMVDLFFYREPEEAKEEETEQEPAPEQPTYGGASGFAAPQGTLTFGSSRSHVLKGDVQAAGSVYVYMTCSEVCLAKFLSRGCGCSTM